MSGLPDRVMTEDELHALFIESAKESVEELKATARSLSEAPADAAERLMLMAETVHVLKGQGSSFGFPLITNVGRSFMMLLKGRQSVDEAVMPLIQIHVDALALVVEQPIQGDGGELGSELVSRLESKVAALG